ncbi:MAG TPA: sensor histidine kinase [Candidatus Limivivens merdigallinarum]|uniref:histidine kinase n=1 Tax=Candidatus Limivivens merdigallinarum TaxID=2840859 RepID=A0A9D0ZUV3_9FIRM|nr:sensor histidine kinase [Candidatus Limivivens merdigallinarum]
MEFLRWKSQWIKSLLLFWVTGWVVFAMYGIPLGPVLYADLLMLGITAVYLGYSYVRYRRKRRILKLWEMNSRYSGAMEKPQGEDCFEETYLRIIENLEQDQQREREAWQNEQKKDREYYTRWSHQIKTPIAATNLLLSEKNLDVRAVKRELFRIEQYADMALQYQRLEGESSDLVLEKVKLHKMVSQTLKKLSTIFVYKKLHVKLGDLEKEIVTDEKWMCFILEQILTNAAKYTEEGGMIEIWLEQEVLCIRDNGIGIQEEDLPRIFEWGYTGYNGRLDKKSTGIGLSLTKEAAGLLQIGISMESQVGRGTTVFLNLAQKRVCGE